MPQKRTDAFRQFDSRQRELNYFLWATERAYGIVKPRQIVKKYPDEMPARQALDDVLIQQVVLAVVGGRI